jgi:hypothetical protein
MPASTQDFESRIDLTGLTTFTASEWMQLINAAKPGENMGLVVETTDSAVNVPDVPNPDVEYEGIIPTHWTKYIWKRNPHADDEDNGIRLYAWNPNAAVNVTFLKWENTETSATEALETAEEALDTANTADTNATTAQTDATNALATANSAVTNIAAVSTQVSSLTNDILALYDSIIQQGVNNGSTTTVLKMLVADYAGGGLVTGLKVSFSSPLAIASGVRLALYQTVASQIGANIFIKKFNQTTRTFELLEAGDIIAGQIVEVTYDGTHWQITSPVGLNAVGNGTSSSIAVHKNLIVQNNSGTPASQIDVDADQVVVTNGTSILTLFNVNLTINALAAVGINGPDIAIAADTWYHIFVIYNPTTATTAGILSQSPTAPTLPTDYTLYGFVGSVYRSGTTFFTFYQANSTAWYSGNKNVFDAKASGIAANNYVTLSGADLTSFETFIPTTAKHWLGTIGLIDTLGGAAWGLAVAADANGLAEQTLIGQGSGGSDFNSFGGTGNFRLPLKTRNMYWKTIALNVDPNHRLNVVGFELI